MKKTTVKDLKNYAKGVKPKVSTVKLGAMDIEIKQEATLIERTSFAAKVYNSSVYEDDGKHVVSNILYRVAYVKTFIEDYTNVSLPADNLEGYDLVTNSGIYEVLYNKVRPEEKAELEKTVQGYFAEKEQEYQQENELSKTVGAFLSGLTDIVPTTEQVTEMFSLMTTAVNVPEEKVEEVVGNVTNIATQQKQEIEE